ncbi:MAG: chemotaxis protein CheW [Deltaproteobacteria bacterium]|nr:MAG: chemotaxis protein CheW [Deltaproteobacteria bacterium]
MMQVATFFVGAQEYALDILRIKEIIVPLPITRVPRAPAFIEGIIELRGAVLPVIDLRKRFGTDAGPPARSTKYVLATVARHVVGLIVDRVGEVLTLDEADLLAPPELAVGEGARFVTAVCRRGDRMIFVIDIDQVLSEAERSDLVRMGETA